MDHPVAHSSDPTQDVASTFSLSMFDDVFYNAIINPGVNEDNPSQAASGIGRALKAQGEGVATDATAIAHATNGGPGNAKTSSKVPGLAFNDFTDSSSYPDLQVTLTPCHKHAHSGHNRLTIDSLDSLTAAGACNDCTFTPPTPPPGAVNSSYLYNHHDPTPISVSPPGDNLTSSTGNKAIRIEPPTIVQPTPSPELLYGRTFPAFASATMPTFYNGNNLLFDASSTYCPTGLKDYESLSAGPTSPVRPLSASSMTTSSSLTSLNSISTSGSSASLSSYASSYGAPPNTFPYNLANRPESPLGPISMSQQQMTSPVGFNAAVDTCSPSKSSSPSRSSHLDPNMLPHLSLGNMSRTPSPLPSPTSAYAAAALINVGSHPGQGGTYMDQTLTRPVTPQTPISGTAALSLSDLYTEDLATGVQPVTGSAKRSRESTDDTHSYSNATTFQSPIRNSTASSPSKRSTVSSSGGSARGDRGDIWPEDVEQAFMEALRVIPKLGRRKVMINGKPCGRNELIADYIRRKTFKLRTRKQVSSHIQVLKNIRRNDEEFMNLVTENFEELEGFPAALLQAGFHMAQIPCLKEELSSTHFGQQYPPLTGLAASPMSPQSAVRGGLGAQSLTTAPYGAGMPLSQAVARAPLQYSESHGFAMPVTPGLRLTRMGAAPVADPSLAKQNDSNPSFHIKAEGGLGPALYDQEASVTST